ncbi:undecaprenyl-diphosphatase [Natronobacillus azotifigens]|uniref:Undecaprenyl-diphosphatase n=1 Tax=Natronobacillus azotifigens TaxID=472978 RepID=A0A9J6RE35_9BACI|nr:undecaprenyl-diphosphate phosphatase [Natronobacillus azotifigens]MCZ0703928.1 undecaprenyl-diphosphate phosphatase [Natronobacillus azotifigens]
MELFDHFVLLIKYIFFGFIQGFTEPIPISSSGHLVIFQDLFGLKMENLSFEILVNSGSLIAVLIIYRQDIIRIIQNSLLYLSKKDIEAKDDFHFILYLILATIPAGLIGFLFEDRIASVFSSANMVGITLIVTGIALWTIRNLRGRKNDGELTWKDALIVGLAQSVALIPGISRSGATIVAAMLLGMKQATALRFSFLLYVPVSSGLLLLSIDRLFDDQLAELWIPYLLALITATIATYFSLRWFMGIMARGNLKYFAFYCFIVGTIAFLIL